MTDLWRVYIVRCSDGTLYTGITNNLVKRIKKHNCGKGAKYTSCRRPVELMYIEPIENKSLALKRESAIKKLSKTEKTSLIESKNPHGISLPLM